MAILAKHTGIGILSRRKTLIGTTLARSSGHIFQMHMQMQAGDSPISLG